MIYLKKIPELFTFDKFYSENKSKLKIKIFTDFLLILSLIGFHSCKITIRANKFGIFMKSAFSFNVFHLNLNTFSPTSWTIHLFSPINFDF